MKIEEDEKMKVWWKQEELQKIVTVTYLGTIISNKNIMDKEINRVIK